MSHPERIKMIRHNIRHFSRHPSIEKFPKFSAYNRIKNEQMRKTTSKWPTKQHTTANGITKLLMIINLKIIVFEKEREKKKSTKKGGKST